MQVSKEQEKEYCDLYLSLLNDPNIILLKNIHMHRGSNCYEHVFKVCKIAYKRALKWKDPLDLKSLIRAAILHDYYLYDWRLDRSKLKGHGKSHPFTAAKNADKLYQLNDLEKEIIKCHMWPLNFFVYPKSREAKIVSISDKIVAIREASTGWKHKEKNREKYLKYISTLI